MYIAIQFPNLAALSRERAFLASRKPAHLTLPVHAAERAAWVRTLDAMPDSKSTRVYLGNEFCRYLLPTAKQVREACTALSDSGLAVSFVLPVVTQTMTDQALTLVAAAESASAGCEIVASDWGTLALLAGSGHTAVAGRQLFKMKRLPRVGEETLPAPAPAGEPMSAASSRRGPGDVGGEADSDLKAVLEEQVHELSEFPPDNPRMIALLSKLGVGRIDTDIVPQGVRFDGTGPKCSLHLPWSYVTGGGECPVARFSTRNGRRVCSKACRSTVVEPRFPYRTWPLMQLGHTVFAQMSALVPHYMSLNRCDRLILAAAPPM